MQLPQHSSCHCHYHGDSSQRKLLANAVSEMRTHTFQTKIIRAIQYVDPTATSYAVVTTTSYTTVTPTFSTTSPANATITNPPDACGSVASASYWTSATTMSDGAWEVWEGYSCAATSEVAFSTAWSTVRSGRLTPTPTPPTSYANSTTIYPTPGTSLPGVPEPSPFPTNITSYPAATITAPVSRLRPPPHLPRTSPARSLRLLRRLQPILPASCLLLWKLPQPTSVARLLKCHR